jgi:hypothetical protein
MHAKGWSRGHDISVLIGTSAQSRQVLVIQFTAI